MSWLSVRGKQRRGRLLSRAVLDYEQALRLDPGDEEYQDSRDGAAEELADRGGPVEVDVQDVNQQPKPASLNRDASPLSNRGVQEETRPMTDEFETTIVTRYDGSPHRMLNCTCTLAADRLIIVDGSGRMYQMLYRDITGVDPRPQGLMSTGVNVVGISETWHIYWKGKAERRELASRISRAISASA